MEESINDLEEIRRSLGYEKWSFAGHSTGGMLGLVYAIRYGSSIDKLIAVGAAASNAYIKSKDSIYCRSNPKNPRLREIFSILRSVEATNEEKANASREWTEMSLHHPEHWDEYFSRPSSGRTVQKRLNHFNLELATYDIRDQLNQIIIPTKILCGKYDSQCPLIFSQELNHLIPGSELHVFQDSNHSPHLEEQSAFTNVIKDFYDNSAIKNDDRNRDVLNEFVN